MAIEDRSIAVTGGAGFIGSWIAESLADANRVLVLDNLITGKKANLTKLKSKIKFINSDIRDAKKVASCLKGTDMVFHQAANVQIPKSVEDPVFDSGINIGGTLNILEACRVHDVGRIVFASSSAVYGEPAALPLKESHEKVPKSPYAASKLVAETYVRIYGELYGLGTASLRYFNVYGPKQNPDSPYSGVISIFIKNIRSGNPLTVFGDGRQTRDFVSVRDVVRANLMAAESKNTGFAVNVGTGKRISLNDIMSILEKLSGTKLKIIRKNARQGDVKHSCADTSLAEKLLGFRAKTGLEEGLKELLMV